MTAKSPQLVDSQEFIDILDYEFKGDEVTVGNKRHFIEQLRLKAAVYVAAKHTGIAKFTAYRWRDSDPQFAQAWDEALQDAADVMESSTYEEALGTEGKPGNALLKMFWLKAHRPKFRDKVSIDIESVMGEIRDRLQALNLKQLPVPNTDFIPVPQARQARQTRQPLHFPDQPDQQQKEHNPQLEHNPDTE